LLAQAKDNNTNGGLACARLAKGNMQQVSFYKTKA